MIRLDALKGLVAELSRGRKLVLLHPGADPDAVGSAVALRHSFPDVDISAAGGLSRQGRRLLEAVGETGIDQPNYEFYDTLVVVDTNNIAALGVPESVWASRKKIVIDHHLHSASLRDVDIYYSDETKPSCAEVVWELIRAAEEGSASALGGGGAPEGERAAGRAGPVEPASAPPAARSGSGAVSSAPPAVHSMKPAVAGPETAPAGPAPFIGAPVPSGSQDRRTPLDRRVALALAAGILTDTAHFRFARAETLRVLLDILERSGLALEEALELVSEDIPDQSRRIAMLKGAQRLRYEQTGGWLIAFSHVSAFEGALSRALISLGADVAFAAAQEGCGFRVSGRASQAVVRSGFHIGRLMEEAGRETGGQGGGHAGAAGMSGVGDMEAALNILVEKTKEWLSRGEAGEGGGSG
ncbi:MAG: DHH family phosphoesterase [Thermoplasmata archaeon]